MLNFPLTDSITCENTFHCRTQVGIISHLCNVGKLHFNAVFIFVSFHGHNLKVTSVEELTADFSVDAAMTRNQTVKFFLLETKFT